MERWGACAGGKASSTFSALSVEPLNGTNSTGVAAWEAIELSVLSLLSR